MELPVPRKVVFDVTKERTTEVYGAESSTENLSAQGETCEKLCVNVRKTVEACFHDGSKPQTIRCTTSAKEFLSLI